jgi:hypothetical protein
LGRSTNIDLWETLKKKTKIKSGRKIKAATTAVPFAPLVGLTVTAERYQRDEMLPCNAGYKSTEVNKDNVPVKNT